jgi:crotonobetainyl-CoA:carnitine CoA-transferase CaiB-like acyl-CoA transferase
VTNAPALQGLKVLDFTWVVVGPSSVRYLSDYGATVVRIESATHIDIVRTVGPFKDGVSGPERSGGYANVNAGKLGLALNLSKPEAREIALKLAAWADIVVENYSPKQMRSWGLDYASLRRVNPNLIMLSSSLNGQTGPDANLAGLGTMGVHLAGFGGLVGWPDRFPVGPWGAYTDYVAPRYIVATLLAAVDHRQRTGEGQYIDLAQIEAGIQFLTPAVLDWTVNARLWPLAGNSSPEHAPHGVFRCAGEDTWVAIAATDDAHWVALCAATGRAEWLTDDRFATLAARLQHREALEAALTEWTAARTAGEIEEQLQAAGVPVHRVTTSDDAFADPQLAFRGHFVEVEHPELGPVPVESSRFRLSRTPGGPSGPGPTIGEHSFQVLEQILGLDGDAIANLVASGALE